MVRRFGNFRQSPSLFLEQAIHARLYGSGFAVIPERLFAGVADVSLGEAIRYDP
jgi:hypothetical protein